MQGCFVLDTSADDDYDIVFKAVPKYIEEGIPQEQEELYEEIELVSSVIKSLKGTSKERKDEYFNKLKSLSDLGLVGPQANPELAQKAIVALKRDILIRETGRIKNSYMLMLGELGLGFIVIVQVLRYFLYTININDFDIYLNSFTGAMIGVWISFGVRKMDMKFEELSVIEDDQLKPAVRLIFVGLCAIVLMLFINSGIVDISIGNINTDSIKQKWELQIIMGIIAGLMEYKLATDIFNKANEIINI